MAILRTVEGGSPGATFSVELDRVVLGRHPDCDIVLDSAAVSRQHAEILRDSGEYYVTDRGSRNGTFVNGERVISRSRIRHRDRLLICDLTFEFLTSDAGPDLGGPSPADDSRMVVLIDDEGQGDTSPAIMSKLDVSTDYGSVRLSAKPEVQLQALIEISQNLSRSLSLDEVLPKLLDSLFRVFLQADRAFIVLEDPDEGVLIPKAFRHRRQSDEAGQISRTIIRQAMEKKEAILSADATSDQRFEMAQSVADFHIRSMMCAPLVTADGISLGAMQIDTMNQRNRFTSEDLEVLAGVASQAAVAIDNARLHEEALQQRALARDLELAHKVQLGLIPKGPPDLPGYHFFHYYEPAYQVGGDYYDYVSLSDGRVAVIVADVSGKGVAAALLMAKLSGEVRYWLASEEDPAMAVSQINNMMARGDWEDRFVTFVVAVLDPRTHEVTVVNAGHMPPLLRKGGGGVEEVGSEETGMPLGVLEDFPFEASTRIIEPGDFFTAFTDGISEAMNTEREIYGLERLAKQVGESAVTVAELGEHILEDVRKFVGSYPQSDDMCVACFGRDEL